MIAFLSGIIILIAVVPFSYYFKSLAKKFEERRLIIYLLGICAITSFFLTNLLVKNLWLYIICFIIMTVFTNMLESITSSLFAKVIPSDYEVGIFNAGNYIG